MEEPIEAIADLAYQYFELARRHEYERTIARRAGMAEAYRHAVYLLLTSDIKTPYADDKDMIWLFHQKNIKYQRWTKKSWPQLFIWFHQLYELEQMEQTAPVRLAQSYIHSKLSIGYDRQEDKPWIAV